MICGGALKWTLRTGVPLLTLLLMYAGLRVAGVAGILLFPFLGTVGVQLYKQGLLFNTKSEA